MKWKAPLDNYIVHIPAYTKQNNIILLPDQATSIAITIGKHASVTLHHIQRISTNITITLESYAQVNFTQWLAKDNTYFTTMTCHQDHNSTFTFIGQYHYNIDATLTMILHGEYAQAAITCTVNAHNNVKSNLHTTQIHKAPHTTSNLSLKGLLYDHTQSIHKGMIHIDAQAHHTDATLQSRYLLMSNKAQAITEPHLEVLNAQVKCFHASAIGTCSNNDLFYLAVRGINKQSAQQLIADAFLK